MVQSSKWIKNNPKDVLWWLDNASECKGEFVFSFDKINRFNLFRDYPHALTPEQKIIFDKENPYWKEFFSGRQ